MKKLVSHYITRINSGHSRSVKAKKNIFASFFIKGVSIIIGFIFVPLLIGYLGDVEYGIWITLSSILAWVNYFDIGLGNGLRNRFAESLAKGEHEMARIYVSTAYVSLALLFGSFFLVFLAINPFLSWYEILKAPAYLASDLNQLVIITFGFFLLRFTFKLISAIILADQRTAISNLFDPLSNLISLIIILVLLKTTEASLLKLGVVLSLSPVLVYLFANFYFFKRIYKPYRPSLKLVNFKYFKDLTGLGAKFFVIQITVVIMMSANNFIITRINSPEAVTPYNIVYKYFGLLLMLFTIITNTLWSAYTEAFVKKDFVWIRKITRNLVKGWVAVLFLLAFMLVISPYFYNIWIGDKVEIPFLLSASAALFFGLYIWYIIFIYFINGTGKITLQLYICVVMAVLNIPIAVFLAGKMGLGPIGVMLGSTIAYLPGSIIAPIQYKKIISGKDRGIWSK